MKAQIQEESQSLLVAGPEKHRQKLQKVLLDNEKKVNVGMLCSLFLSLCVCGTFALTSAVAKVIATEELSQSEVDPSAITFWMVVEKGALTVAILSVIPLFTLPFCGCITYMAVQKAMGR